MPVLLENNAFVAPVEPITEMYSMPNRDDVDPNPVMAFFYYVFFGIMLSDAGYGVIMVIAMLIAKAKLKLEPRMKKRSICSYIAESRPCSGARCSAAGSATRRRS